MDFAVNSLQKNDILFSFPELKAPVDLGQVDPYSLESLEDLLRARTSVGLDFYATFFKQDGRSYFFEASRFVEQIFRKNPRNPLTNIEISYFEILRYAGERQSFEPYCSSEQIKDPFFYVPIVINDHTRTEEEKQEYLHRVGQSYLKEESYDLTKALEYLTQAAK